MHQEVLEKMPHKLEINLKTNFKENVDKTRFNNNSDTLSGIQIAINDVWAYKISLTEYYLKNNEPHGKLQFDFYDHFGLDFPDIEKFD
jgi:hypothetical protein